MNNVKTQIRTFLSKFFRNADLKDDEDIFALGLVNSLFAMQLVMFVEKEFELSVCNDDLDIDNFKSVDAMAKFVERKKSASSG